MISFTTCNGSIKPLLVSAHWLCAHIFAYESRQEKTKPINCGSVRKNRESVLSGIFQIPGRLECFPHIKDVWEFPKLMLSNKQKGTVVVTSCLIQAFNVRVMFPLWPTDTLFWDLWLFDIISCFHKSIWIQIIFKLWLLCCTAGLLVTKRPAWAL